MANQLPKADFNGELNIADFSITCAVLDNGQRVISERSFASALGVKGGGAYWQQKKTAKDTSVILPEYVSATYLKPYFTPEIEEKLTSPIRYISKFGSEANGFPAEVIPDICHIWLEARKHKALKTDTQKHIAEKAYLLLRGFAHVGIIALVDEATGYQNFRTRQALQEILSKFISKELQPWVKTFPDDYYEEYFRLRNWKYTVSNVNRPGIVGKDTNDIIYARLAPVVLEELKKKTPRDEKGKLKHHYHRLLTDDVGHPKLREHISNVITLMRASSSWKGFIKLLNKAMPRFGETYELPFDEE